jgi:hypothetical protein
MQTYIVDGDKGGVGKSLTTRALVHYFLTAPDRPPVIAVFDADMSNPDVCGKEGLSVNNSNLVLAQILDLSIEQGWIELANHIDELRKEYKNEDIRIVINMPAQIGARAFQGNIPIVSEVLREANAFPVWLLSRTGESIRTLEERLRVMPERFRTGLILRNLFFGEKNKFSLWEDSALRTAIIKNANGIANNCGDGDDPGEGFNWIEDEFPDINDTVITSIGRMPFHMAVGIKDDGEPYLKHGYRLTLKTFLRGTRITFEEMEKFIARGNAGNGEISTIPILEGANG